MPVNASTAIGYSVILLINLNRDRSYAITGPNGSGKVNIVAGAERSNACSMKEILKYEAGSQKSEMT